MLYKREMGMKYKGKIVNSYSILIINELKFKLKRIIIFFLILFKILIFFLV